MKDFRQYYATIRAKQTELGPEFPEGCCLVMSVQSLERNSPGGNVCEVSLYDAARLLTDGTHRLATKEETVAFRERNDIMRSRNTHADLLSAARRQFVD